MSHPASFTGLTARTPIGDVPDRIAVRSLVMRSSVARCARRIVRVIGPVSAVILAGVTTAQAQAVPRQAPPLELA